ncbi:MAG TPA: acyltransferase [Baekduia sp.]|jgi:peptidoglycan/LPS O-acetylase OafA/YrhL|nr:acyltransferase [Baekduia sp.]
MKTEPSVKADRPVALQPPPGNPRYPLFDSCRGLAALSVLLFHVGAIGGGNLDGPLRELGRNLNIGVPIFFAISGFLLYRPFLHARIGGGAPLSLRGYARRRVLRIVPGYWVALTALAVFSGWSAVFGPEFWRYYGFAQIYARDTFDGGIGVAWTLCIEASFYVLLPLFALLMARLSRGRDLRATVRLEVAVLLGLGVASAVTRAILGEHSGYIFPVSMLPGTFVWFVPGMLLAVGSVAASRGVAGRGLRWALLPEHGTQVWLLAVLSFAALCVVGAVDVPQYVADGVLTPLVALLFLIPAAVERTLERRSVNAVPQAVLGLPALLWLGLISYGLYLYHATLLAWLDAHGADRIFPFNHWIGLAIATLLVTIPVAAGSWYAVERPAVRFGSRRPRLGRQPRPSAPVRDVLPEPEAERSIA